jgi:hypothetical protein
MPVENPQRPHPDPYWREVCDVVATLGVARGRTVAPAEFGEYLAGTVPYAGSSSRLWEEIDCVVIHKGWVKQLSDEFLAEMLRCLAPTLANPVFVVYGRGDIEVAHGPHVDSFLNLLPRAVHAAATNPTREPSVGRAAPVQQRKAFAVFLGNGRMLCRDPDNRKIVLPAKASMLLAALLDGENVVAAIHAKIAALASGARTIVDVGAGCGLFSLAAKAVVADNALFLAVEADPLLAQCVRYNVELSGLFWRTEFATGLDSPRDRQFAGRHKNESWNPSHDADIVHLDVAYEKTPHGPELSRFLKERKFPAVVASNGLSTRNLETAADDFSTIEATLRQLGYQRELAPAVERRMVRIGDEIATFRSPARRR